MHSTTSKPSGS